MNNHRDILIIDTETGGFNPSINGLLSISAKLFNTDETYTAYMKPSKDYIYEDSALKVNNLNLEELEKNGLSHLDMCKSFFRWLLEISAKYNILEFRVLGHNINFDINFLKELYKFTPQYNPFKHKLFDYHYIDTSIIVSYLRDQEKIHPENNKLISVYKYFKGIEEDELISNAHRSDIDVLMTEFIYSEMLKLN